MATGAPLRRVGRAAKLTLKWSALAVAGTAAVTALRTVVICRRATAELADN